MLDIEKSLLEKLTCLDSDNRRPVQRKAVENDPLDAPTRELYANFKEIQKKISDLIDKGYFDIVTVAVAHVLCQLIDEINEEDPELGKLLHTKALELLLGVQV